MYTVRYMTLEDKEFWYSLDRHLPEREFANKVRDRQGYVISEDGRPVGLLRYNLFWDNTPFCTLLYIESAHQGRGFGRALMEHWEADMRSCGYEFVLTSTQVNEDAQHFYRKLGYKDCGGFVIDLPNHREPMELFMIKEIQRKAEE